MEWEVDQVRKRLKKFFCMACKKIIIEPVQSLCCGLRLCRSCVGENCPDCGLTLKHFSDTAFLKECQILTISCPLCEIWNGLILDFQAHLDCNHENYFDNIFNSDELEPATGGFMFTEDISLRSYSHHDDEVVPNRSDDAPFVMPSSIAVDQGEHDEFLCGSCGKSLMLVDFAEHISTCYKLHKYKCACYSYEKLIFEEIGGFGAREMVTGYESSTMNIPQVSYAISDLALYRSIQLRDRKLLEQTKTMQMHCSPMDIPDYGGTRWKITDISICSKDVDHPDIRSSRFYSSSDGYCFRLGLHFGDKQDQLLVLLQKGKHDATLSFPFRGQIDVGILSFSSATGGIYQKFLSCNATQCFSEFRDSIAISLPIPKLYGSDFVYEDDIYINCVVQAEGP